MTCLMNKKRLKTMEPLTNLSSIIIAGNLLTTARISDALLMKCRYEC